MHVRTYVVDWTTITDLMRLYTAMWESPEERLDSDIARTLKFDTLISAKQQQKAKERLLLAAAAHPPVIVEESVPLSQRLYTLRCFTVRALELLLTDTSVFERAHRPRRPRPYYSIYGRYTFSMIYMSA